MACTRITHRRVHIVSVSLLCISTLFFCISMLVLSSLCCFSLSLHFTSVPPCGFGLCMCNLWRLCYHLWCDRTKTQFINVYSNSSNSGMAVIYALNLVVAAPRLRDFLPFGWRRTPPVFRSRALVAASRLTLHTLVAAPRLHNGLPFWSRHTQPNSNIAIILRHSLTCWWRPPASIVASHAAGGLPP